ncbi:MAG TPA: DnaA/Hda family protein [Rhodocyclaceae bacterium]
MSTAAGTTEAQPGRQLLLDLLPPPAPNFDNFIVGGNAEALAALREWLSLPGSPTCFLLWGEAHSGRRHLLAASGLPLVDAAATELDVAAALAAQTAPALAVANADRLDAAGQTALFVAFNHRRQNRGKLLLSSVQPPAALAIREDLRTRLGSGLVYRLNALSDAEKSAALLARAEALGLELPAGTLDFLFSRSARDLGTLTALIDALDRYTLEHRRPVTLPLLRRLLESEPNPEPLTVNR